MKWALKRNIILSLLSTLLFTACQKEGARTEIQNELFKSGTPKKDAGHLKQTKTFSSEVAIKWMDMQVRLMKANPTAFANVAFSRPYAYSGIALYESVVGGMPTYQSIASQLNGLNGLPQTGPGLAYNWAVTSNTALAYINKKFFPGASAGNKAAMDSLEAALNAQYNTDVDAAIINRSIEFGKTVAQKVFDWAETDGYLHANDPYTPSASKTGPAFWVPPLTPSIQTAPYWEKLRRLVPGSGDNAQPGPPPAYSEDPQSDFYKMAKEVYDLSAAPGSANEAMALYWRDVPGTTTPGHFVSILKQVLESDQPTLDIAAISYAMAGISVFDASVSNWQTKYNYNLVRPVTYIRNVLKFTTWSPFLNTPPHPEYPSGHASLSAANAQVLTIVFGENHSFIDHSFDYLGFPSRSYSSFREAGEEAGLSRLYAGIHYRNSIDAGLWQGKKVVQNITGKLKFLKE